MKKKYTAFTLAETLITLGIIGIVAAITLPTLITKYNEKITVNKVKKAYSFLSQLYLQAANSYGTPDEWGTTQKDLGDSSNEETYNAPNATIIRNNLFSSAKQIQTCNNAKNQKACGVADTIYFANGNKNPELAGTSAKTTSVVTSDGTTYIIISSKPGENKGKGVLAQTYGMIYIDINGIKSPNTYGKDIFMFYLTKQNIMPAGSVFETKWPFSSCKNHGGGCTAWLIFNENMDYLHCIDKLSWQTNHNCKEAK